MRTTRLCMLAAAAITIFSAGAARAQLEPASMADDFVDRIGVCTHWSYADTPYGTAYEKVKQLLADAGIRHIRDGFQPHEVDLYNDLGVKTTMIFGPPDPAAAVKTAHDNRLLIDMVEGPNEVDISPKNAEYQGKGFPDGARQFEIDLYTALKGDPYTENLGVIAPSTARAGSNRLLRPLKDFDYLVMHSYAGGQMPSRSLESDVNNNLLNAYDLIGPGMPLKPIVVTESGYHTALGSSVVAAGVQPGVSEKAQAKYLLRHFATYYAAGILRTFSYEFLDEFPDYATSESAATNAEACFGMVKHDLTPKPAYTALRNLISLLSERRWNKSQKAWIWEAVGNQRAGGVSALHRLDALDFKLSGGPGLARIRHLVLQKQTGDFYLLLWQEAPSFDLATRRDIDNPAVPVTLTLGTAIRGGAVYDPVRGTDATQIFSATKSVIIPVPDELLVVQLSPVHFFPPTMRTLVDKVSAKTTGTEVKLNWEPAHGPQPEGYFVSRLGKFLGRTSTPSFVDTGLRPGTGYLYSLRAYDAFGRVGAALQFTAFTKSVYPDLTVTAVSMTPPHAVPGMPVRFSATIRNMGKAPTPAGVTVGVAFSVDGQVVNWSDTFAGPLAPGESRVLTANNGPNKKATWTWTAGTHVLRAVVDDVNRITESDKTNNALQINVPAP